MKPALPISFTSILSASEESGARGNKPGKRIATRVYITPFNPEKPS